MNCIQPITQHLRHPPHIYRNRDQEHITLSGLQRVLPCYLLHIPVYRRFEFRCATASVLEGTFDEQDDLWRLIRFNQELW